MRIYLSILAGGATYDGILYENGDSRKYISTRKYTWNLRQT